ncbi:hypothetical protein NEIELOOT_03122 [Neisseria elongata subsp. glycolytica ATCC 29315]|uniref:Uncharacterized protein n=1 Tax=Neisseria elongata subsp. glycolytica ATCC 29315 TaxID=546263 RepID=D4DVK4_NEIEG|nr:hypothetical protein NEIELOOT_03122 [Neisseria elongata subsp. glycolytica ATCC 29315]
MGFIRYGAGLKEGCNANYTRLRKGRQKYPCRPLVLADFRRPYQ